jgi:hypothetical protein
MCFFIELERDWRREGLDGVGFFVGNVLFGRSSFTHRFMPQLLASQSICPANISRTSTSRVLHIKVAYATHKP